MEISSSNNFTADSGSKWASIKTQAEEKAKPKENFEIKEWHLNNADGTLINDETEFKEDTTVFAISKRKVVQYKVEHLKENIENDEFTKAEEETKTGEAGKNTSAEAKQYEGFSCQGLAQEAIKADGSTVVQIKYKRNRVSLILDLAGGKTTPALEDGTDGKKLLKGKFEARVEVKGLEKENHGFEKWEPALPEKFPATSSSTIYTAKWTRDSITITVEGDENVVLGTPKTVSVAKGAKWAEIKTQAEEKAKPKENFEIKEWHLNNAGGILIKDETEFKEDTTVFAVSKRKVVQYKVEHLKENIENDEFTKVEEETKTGDAGKNTSAEAKQYEGFSCQGLAQVAIKADGSTVVQIKYKRNRVSLILDLAGGKTTPTLEDGEDGKKLLKGKFEAKVEVKGLEKENYGFEKWEPELPQTFPATSSNTIHKAKWKRGSVTITVNGDNGIEIASPDNFTVDKGSKWADIKTQAIEKAKAKAHFELLEWHLSESTGTLITDETEFKENATIFAVSKEKPKAKYKVEHCQQNLLNEEYTKKEIEEKEGFAGEETEAEAKPYPGFTANTFKQKEIKANGKTLVRILYKRNIVSLIIDLKGGETTTELQDGTGGKKLLTGKFEGEVSIKTPTKQGVQFEGWEPELPTNFPANDETVYTAKWGAKTAYRVTIEGDERVKVAEPQYIDVPIGSNKKIENIKAEIIAKASLASGWSSEDYTFYDWRIGGEKGEEMQDATPINGDIVVYARTNYKRFKLSGTTLKGYEGEKPRGRIFIPKNVVKISYEAFEECDRLTAVDLSGCTEVKEIGSSAFSKCGSLESIDLSLCTKLTMIGVKAFSGCSKLKSVDLSGCTELIEIRGFRWNDGAFYACSSLESIDLSPCVKLTKIEGGAFSDCSKLKSVDLSGCSEITEIGAYAFSNCSSLESIDLSACHKLTEIKMSVFSYCSKLKSVDLSGCTELIEIGAYAFSNCSSLESIYLSPCVKLTKIGNEAFRDCSKLKSVDLSGCTELTVIEGRNNYSGACGAFYACSSLESIDLSPCVKLTKIGYEAFSGCSKLKSVDLSGCGELTEINDDAFHGCESLESIDLSPCTKLKWLSGFSYCIKLKSVDLNGCTELIEIGDYAFRDCSSLESMDLLACTKLTKIGEKAFSSCSKLKSVDLSDCTELIEIGFYAFHECTSLESIDLSPCVKLTRIKSNVFSDCTNGVVKLPASITEVKKEAFGGKNETYCKKVLVPNEEIKQLVIKSGYPENRIEMY